jgi:YidC/Oxa1 family membrane protein insertase
MEKRVVIAVVLSFLVLYLYQAFLAPPPPKRPVSPATGQAQQAGPAGPSTPGETSPAPARPGGQTAAPDAMVSAAPAAATMVGETTEREVVVETGLVRAVFTNRGARLKHWELKNYHDDTGRHVDMVPQRLGAGAQPFSLRTGDQGIDARLNSALFKVVEDGRAGGPAAPRRLVFEFRDAAGLTARKAFELAPSAYTIGFVADASVGSAAANLAVDMGPWVGDVETSTLTSYAQKANGVVHAAGALTRFDASSIMAGPEHQGSYDYAGVDDHYFLSVALLGGKSDTGIHYRHYWVPKTGTKDAQDFVAYRLNPAGPGVNTTFFIGPKVFDALQATDRNLVRAINFGMFAWLAVPLLKALIGVNAYLNNYGWSIIVLTVLINLLIFPLRHKSFVSMRKMQALQPEVKAIQDRYSKLKAADPEKQKMNAELMALYKERGVNPASGCVPILLTMPLLFAFYSLLSAAIELRGAPFMWWIKDLSAYDPWYIWPVLMGITMVVQQRMTPSQADPVQQKMMMLMPVMFMVMFLWAPSGLVIYWFVSNVLAIGQQYATNQLLAPVTAKDLRPVKQK